MKLWELREWVFYPRRAMQRKRVSKGLETVRDLLRVLEERSQEANR